MLSTSGYNLATREPRSAQGSETKGEMGQTKQHDSSLAGFHCTDETEIIVNQLMTNVDHEQPLNVINFDCDEAIASEQQQQDVIANFDLSLLDM